MNYFHWLRPSGRKWRRQAIIGRRRFPLRAVESVEKCAWECFCEGAKSRPLVVRNTALFHKGALTSRELSPRNFPFGHDPRSGARGRYLYIARVSGMEPLSRTTAATIDVLRVLAESPDPSWGLLVIKSSGRPAGTVYPILERLESLGWVTSSWDSDDSRSGPRRRYYELTEEGGTAASSAIEAFAARSRVATPARNIAARAVMA